MIINAGNACALFKRRSLADNSPVVFCQIYLTPLSPLDPRLTPSFADHHALLSPQNLRIASQSERFGIETGNQTSRCF